MSDVGGENGWEVHPVVRLPLHSGQCRVCREYRNHAIDMNKENWERVAVDMARAWGQQGYGELKVENAKLREERDEARAESDELKKRLEELEKSAHPRKERSPEVSRAPSHRVDEGGTREAWPGPTESQLGLNSRSEGLRIITPNLPIPTRRVGRGDIVGFGPNGVYILRNRDFVCPKATKREISGYGFNNGWLVDQHVRLVGDTTGSGFADIIGFGPDGIYVARNNGTSFSPPARILPSLVPTRVGNQGNTPDTLLTCAGRGWQVNQHPRFLIDLTGDRILDIVAFGQDQVFVSLGKGDGSFKPSQTINVDRLAFSGAKWMTSGDSRTLGDLTGDGKPDIVGFATGGVYVALNNGNGTFQSPKLALDHFGTAAARCKYDRYLLADVNADGLADIVAFSPGGVWVAIGNGDGTFQPLELVTQDFSEAYGWRDDKHPRFVVDLTGNGAADIIGFGNNGVWVSYNNGRGEFEKIQKLTDEFSVDSGWSVDDTVRWIANLGSM